MRKNIWKIILLMMVLLCVGCGNRDAVSNQSNSTSKEYEKENKTEGNLIQEEKGNVIIGEKYYVLKCKDDWEFPNLNDSYEIYLVLEHVGSGERVYVEWMNSVKKAKYVNWIKLMPGDMVIAKEDEFFELIEKQSDESILKGVAGYENHPLKERIK